MALEDRAASRIMGITQETIRRHEIQDPAEWEEVKS
jgi:hypothetical protein